MTLPISADPLMPFCVGGIVILAGLLWRQEDFADRRELSSYGLRRPVKILDDRRGRADRPWRPPDLAGLRLAPITPMMPRHRCCVA
jgi:hypothetical protein